MKPQSGQPYRSTEAKKADRPTKAEKVYDALKKDRKKAAADAAAQAK